MLDTLITVFLVGVNDGLGVTIGAEVMAAFLKFLLKLTIVVDFPVQDDENAPIFVKNGLVAAGQVNDREAAHPKCSSVTHPGSLIVRPTVANDLAHTIDELLCV